MSRFFRDVLIFILLRSDQAGLLTSMASKLEKNQNGTRKNSFVAIFTSMVLEFFKDILNHVYDRNI